jgi:hypothetical protein
MQCINSDLYSANLIPNAENRMKQQNIFYYIVKIILYKEIFFLIRIREINNDLPMMSLLYYLAMKSSTMKKYTNFLASSKIHSRHRSFHHNLTTV